MPPKPTIEQTREAGRITEEAIRKAIKKQGLSVEAIVKPIKAALKACVTKTAYRKSKGKWVYSRPLIDHVTRLKAADQGAKLLGAYPAEKTDMDHSGEITLKVVYDDKLNGKDEN